MAGISQIRQVGRIVECCLKQKGAYYLHLARQTAIMFLASGAKQILWEEYLLKIINPVCRYIVLRQ